MDDEKKGNHTNYSPAQNYCEDAKRWQAIPSAEELKREHPDWNENDIKNARIHNAFSCDDSYQMATIQDDKIYIAMSDRQYADNAEKRLVELNRSECIPFAFRIYATYEVPKRLTDLNLHNLIDKLNPTLRAIDTFNGKPRKKEFYAMSKEDAYSLLEAIAEIHDCTDKLKLYPVSEEDQAAEDTAELVEIEASGKKKTQPISLEEYLSSKNQDMVELYIQLQSNVYDALADVEMHVLPQYVGWKINGKYFAEIHVQKNRVMMLTLEPSNVYSIGNKLPDHFLWSLNYLTFIGSTDDLEAAKSILTDSFIKRS